jgi:hypothetical protein
MRGLSCATAPRVLDDLRPAFTSWCHAVNADGVLVSGCSRGRRLSVGIRSEVCSHDPETVLQPLATSVAITATWSTQVRMVCWLPQPGSFSLGHMGIMRYDQGAVWTLRRSRDQHRGG